MSLTDKATRDKAVPFQALPFDGINSGYNKLVQTSKVEEVNPIRMTQPEKGDIIEAYFTLQMTAPDASDINMRLAIGEYQDGTDDPKQSYSNAYLDRHHRVITGQDSPLNIPAGTQKIFLELNMLSLIPQRGDPNYRSDAFILVIEFDSAPSGSGYSVDKFVLSCSAQMGLI